MERLRRAGQWAKAADTTLSLGDMALRIIGASTVLGGVAAVITWFAANPYATLVIGLVVWIVVAIVLLLVMSRRAQSETSLVTEAQTETEDYLSFPLPRSLAPDVAASSHISGESFRITDVSQGDGTIRNKTFEDCTLHGPAVVLLQGVGSFHDSRFIGNANSVFWSIEPGRGSVVGALSLVNCVFRGCTLVRIGVAGSPDEIRQWIEEGFA